MKRFIKSTGRALLPVLLLAATVTLLPSTASAVSPATFTTDVDGVAVNANHYDEKCDVYYSGGPDGAGLPDGTYVFFVLAPSGQADPNGPNLLSTTTNAERTFSVSSGTVSYGGPHGTSVDLDNNELLIQVCHYNTTPNAGGVYIAAICPADNQTPSGCKYDAFKVRADDTTGNSAADLVATKTATPSFSRAFTWDVAKSVDRTSVTQAGGSATFNYEVVATKSAPSDSGFAVSGAVQVFNPNASTVTGVAVTDAIGLVNCTVTGGDTTIVAGGSETFNYTCTGLTATAAASGTNTATVTWTQSSIGSPTDTATATAGFNFASTTPTVTGNCTDVTDTFGPRGSTGTATTLATGLCATQTFPYSQAIAIPASGCLTYDNTAAVTGDTDSKSVQVCRPNNTGGFTMGYWQNKNGQAQIGAAAAALCTYLGQYSSVLTMPTDCARNLKRYVSDVIKAANASLDGAPMYKGQFLATALSAYFNSSLASSQVVVPGSLLGTGDCLPVSALLTAGNLQYSALLADKANLNAVKDVYDRINNNRQPLCGA